MKRDVGGPDGEVVVQGVERARASRPFPSLGYKTRGPFGSV